MVLPEHLTNLSPFWFVAELAFVVVLLAGMVAVWTLLTRLTPGRRLPLWARVSEAAIAVPWIAFTALFLAAIAGGLRPALVLVQVLLGLAGLHLLWSRRADARSAWDSALSALRESWYSVGALLVVLLFVFWPWVVPFPEAFNGHHHDLLSLSSELWRSGSYPALSESAVAYDTEVLASAPPVAFFLSLFSIPGVDVVSTRPVLLLPGVFALLTWQLLRLTVRELGASAWAGSVAFLLACFGYYTAGEFMDISPDLFSPLIVSYAGYLIARWVLHDRPDWLGLLLALAFSALVRKQVFLLLVAIVAVVLVAKLVPWRRLGAAIADRPRSGKAITAGLLIAPVAAWTVYVTIQYGSPLFPQDSRTGAFGLWHFDELLNSPIDLRQQFLPLYFTTDPGILVRNVFGGITYSLVLSLAIIHFFFVAPRLERGRLLRRLALAYSIGFLLVLYFVFPAYPKYAHYSEYLLAPFAAIGLAWLARRGIGRVAVPVLMAGVFVGGVGLWATSTWGHATTEFSLTNVKLLNPFYGSEIERLSRRTVRSPDSLRREIEEYNAALDSLAPGERILHGELEPGSLIPSLVDREFLGDVLYLESPRTESIVDADSVPALRDAFEALGVTYVYRPQRPHFTIADSLVIRQIAAYADADRYLIPVEELLAAQASTQPPY